VFGFGGIKKSAGTRRGRRLVWGKGTDDISQ
jgi:hypothetical protein